VAEDASDNTKKSYTDMCSFKKVPVIFYGNKETIGKCIGCEERAAVVLTDEGFANAVNKQISQKDIKN
jgi:ribosomal protein L7Ae-like RNA K-turn-binding protein